MQILKSNGSTRFALSRVPAPELKGNFQCRVNSSSDKDFEQQLETLPFKGKTVDGVSPHDEETRHRILHAKTFALKRQCSPRACPRDRNPEWVPTAHPVFRCVPACDCDIVSV